MELFPEIKLALLNGWAPLLLFYAVFGILLMVFPKQVVARLYERSGWSKWMIVLRVFVLMIMFTWFFLVILTPLKVGSFVFIFGGLLYALGLIGFVVALFNFRDTPLDRPITHGLYSFSRNPQQVTIFLSFLGISVAIGSWIATLLISIAIALGHARVLAEERACLERYGETYKNYLKQVPRYFVFI